MKRIFKFCIIATILCININSCYSNTRDDCGSTLIIDGSTHVTLQSKNANKIIEPASFAKLMTIAVVLDFLHDNKINLKQEVEITHDIWIKGGAPSGSSSMFTALNSKVSVENLLWLTMQASPLSSTTNAISISYSQIPLCKTFIFILGTHHLRWSFIYMMSIRRCHFMISVGFV